MGFFSTHELSKSAKVKIDKNKIDSNCAECPLKSNSVMKTELAGEGKKKILVIGEFPVEEDSKYGTAYNGEEGDIIYDAFRDNNIDFYKDCWRTHAVKCKSDTLIPDNKVVDLCSPHIIKLVHKLKPKLIIAFGDTAIKALFRDSYSNCEQMRWRRFCIPDEKLGCNIVPLVSPYYLIENPHDKNRRSQFMRDIKFALSCRRKPFIPRKDYESYVKSLTDFKEVKALLKRVIKKKETIAYDYEATGLKPFKKGHKVVSIGFATSEDKAYAFPFDYNDFWTPVERNTIKRLWMNILKDKKIKKIAYNAKFEEIWSTIMFKTRPFHIFDPMMAAHIMDNRKGILSLKFQSFVHLGVRPYDLHMKKYLKADKNSEFNNVEKAPLKDLLLYNGLDCVFTFILYKRYKGLLKKDRGRQKSFDFFMDGLRTMASLQLNGIHMNQEYYEEVGKDISRKIKKIKKRLERGREAKAFSRKFKRKININSNQDLGLLFYEVLGKDPIRTNKGNYKTDKKTLLSLNLPFVDNLLEMKKFEKAKGTYLGQFSREIVYHLGKMFPFFDLSIPISYRSSSSSPNWQNIPKRDKTIKALIRMGVIPSPNCALSEIDFSGAEVTTSVTYHKDKNFYNYLTDPTTDMHRDNATDLLMLPPGMLNDPKMTKEQKASAKMIRFFAKNNWTFAQFYGDYFGSCAPVFWENVVEAGLKLPNGQLVSEWLEDKGIFELGEIEKGKPTPGSFLEHCSKVEKKMWDERFPEYKKWKEEINQYYIDHGFIKNHFGFVFIGYMGKNQCTNFPIQSASFHLLLHTLIEVEKELNRRGMKTKIIGQIHDSIIADIHKTEIKKYVRIVNRVVKNLTNDFPWLSVPMEIEVELSKLRENGGNFSELEEFTVKEIFKGKHKEFIGG